MRLVMQFTVLLASTYVLEMMVMGVAEIEKATATIKHLKLGRWAQACNPPTHCLWVTCQFLWAVWLGSSSPLD